MASASPPLTRSAHRVRVIWTSNVAYKLPSAVPYDLSIRRSPGLGRLFQTFNRLSEFVRTDLPATAVRANPTKAEDVRALLADPAIRQPLDAVLSDKRISLRLERDFLWMSFDDDHRNCGLLQLDSMLELAHALLRAT